MRYILGLGSTALLLCMGCVGDAPALAPDAAADGGSADGPVSNDAQTLDSSLPDAPAPDASDGGSALPYRVFLTTDVHNGAFGATASDARTNADGFCAAQASGGSKTKPVGPRVWRAFLSVDGSAAVKRIKGTGPWVRVDGSAFGDIRPDGQSHPKTVANPPNLDQNGQLLAGGRAWVGGYAFVNPSFYPDCSGFTKTGNGSTSDTAGSTANTGSTGPAWGEDTGGGAVLACVESYHVYCVEDEP